MGTHGVLKRLQVAIALAALGSVLFTSFGLAQPYEPGGAQPAAQSTTAQPASQSTTGQPAGTTAPPGGPFVVRVQTPNTGTRISGNFTFTGAAVDCGRGIPATRVAVYDGTD